MAASSKKWPHTAQDTSAALLAALKAETARADKETVRVGLFKDKADLVNFAAKVDELRELDRREAKG